MSEPWRPLLGLEDPRWADARGPSSIAGARLVTVVLPLWAVTCRSCGATTRCAQEHRPSTCKGCWGGRVDVAPAVPSTMSMEVLR